MHLRPPEAEWDDRFVEAYARYALRVCQMLNYVMAGLILKYGCQVLERHKNAAKEQDAVYDNEPQEEILQKAA